MRKLRIVSVVLGLVVLLAAFPATTGAQTTGTWNSGFQLQNLDLVSAASVVICYYNEDGSLEIDPCPTDTIDPAKSKTYYLPSISGLGDGQYSVVVSSSTNVAAVANLTNSGASMADSYLGFTGGAAQANMPLVFRTSNWNSKITVQAVSAAQIYIEFFAPGATSPTLRYPTSGTTSIPAGAGKTFDIASSTFSALGSSFVGSAKVYAASGEVVAIVQELRSVGYSVVTILPGSTTSGKKLLAPLVYNDFQLGSYATGLAWRTGIQVQNIGSVQTYARLTVTGVNVAGTWTVTKAVPANNSVTFYLPSESAVQKDMYGSAVIESCADESCTTPGNGENIVGIVNTTKYGQGVAMAYNAFVDGSATNKISIPLAYGTFQQGLVGVGKEWRSGIQVMNVSSTSTTVRAKATFTNANVNLTGGPWTVTSGDILPGESYTFYLPNVSTLPLEFYGSVAIEAVDGSGTSVNEPIIAIVNTTKYVSNFATCYPGVNHN